MAGNPQKPYVFDYNATEKAHMIEKRKDYNLYLEKVSITYV